jgi:Ca-activated chloride channel family protein
MVGGSTFVPPVQVATDPGRERYEGEEVSPVKLTAAEPVSTFAVDVDTGAYANARRFLTQGMLPPQDTVRTEEMINYFRYDYARPTDRSQPFTVTTDLAKTPWNPDSYLMRIGLRGYDIDTAERPPANLVFLLDVSGSMSDPDKLPLVKTALAGLASELSARDRVSIVVYAGAAGLVLEPTNDTSKIRRALDSLSAGGSTAGGAGIELAYRVAEGTFIKGGVNRVILATDGDFNVGLSDTGALIELIEKKRESGITLTTLGFGQGNYNEAMMEQIANKGNGNYAYIDTALEARKVLVDEMQSTLFTIAKDVKIQVEFNPAVIAQYRLIGYENRALREEDFDNDLVDAGEIGAGHQVTAIYELELVKDASPSASLATVRVRHKAPQATKAEEAAFRFDPVQRAAAFGEAAADLRFAFAVAAFADVLRGGEDAEHWSLAEIERIARDASGDDADRRELVALIGRARTLKEGPKAAVAR